MPVPVGGPPNPTRREVTLDAAGHLAEDVPCRGCGYNLRGIAADASCPECGVPLWRSVHGDLLQFSERVWVARIVRGLTFVLAGIIGGVIAGLALLAFMFAGGFQSTGPGGPIQLASSGLATVTAAVVVYGIWLCTTPDPAIIATERRLSARRLARGCVMAHLLGSPIQMNFSSLGMAGGGGLVAVGTLVSLASTMLSLVAIVGYVAGLRYLGHLMKRVPSPALARQCRIVMWGFALSQGLGVGLALVMIAAILPALVVGRMGSAGMVLYGGFGCASGLGSVVFGLWGIILLFAARAALQRVVRRMDHWVEVTAAVDDMTSGDDPCLSS